MPSRPFEFQLLEWDLQTQADIDDCAEVLSERGFASNVYREIQGETVVRRIEIHRLDDSSPALKASIGQWVVLLGPLIEVLSQDEHAEKYPSS